MFEMAERGTDIVPSVSLLYARFHKASLLRRCVDSSGEPRHTDVPIPRSAFIKEWLRSYNGRITSTESSVVKVFVFENVKSTKELEVFVWNTEQSGT